MQLFDVKKLDDSCAWSVDCVFCYIRVLQWFMSCKNIVCVCGNFFLSKSFLANCFQFPQRVVLFEVPREFKYCNKLNSRHYYHKPLINSYVYFISAPLETKISIKFCHCFYFLIGIIFQSWKKYISMHEAKEERNRWILNKLNWGIENLKKIKIKKKI